MLKIAGLVIGTESEIAAEISKRTEPLIEAELKKMRREFMSSFEESMSRAAILKEEVWRLRDKARNAVAELQELRRVNSLLWARIGMATADIEAGNPKKALKELTRPNRN